MHFVVAMFSNFFSSLLMTQIFLSATLRRSILLLITQPNGHLCPSRTQQDRPDKISFFRDILISRKKSQLMKPHQLRLISFYRELTLVSFPYLFPINIFSTYFTKVKYVEKILIGRFKNYVFCLIL